MKGAKGAIAVLLIWGIGLLTGLGLGSALFGGYEPIDMDQVLSTSGEWVDLMPAGWHFISCMECGYTYRFFYNAPGSWRATLSHDPLATVFMREMMEIDPKALDAEPEEESPELGPPEPDEPERDL